MPPCRRSRNNEQRAATADDSPDRPARRLSGPEGRYRCRLGVQLDFIRPGKPTENGYIESINGKLRDECLNVQQFVSLEDAKQKIEAWHDDYNTVRPYSSLGHLAPGTYAGLRQGQAIAEAA